MTKRKTWAEYKREQRARERKRLRDMEDQVGFYLKQPFFEYIEENNVTDIFWHGAVLGNEWYKFDDDSGLKLDDNYALENNFIDEKDKFNKIGNSINKAEFVVSHLIDTAAHLADTINEYKKKEIGDRLNEIEMRDLSDPVARKQADAEIVRLKKLLDQLDKQVRWTFPQWKVTGD